MANLIKIKGKLSAGAPTLASLVDREMCIVIPDGNLYMRLNATTLVLLGGAGKVGSDSPALTGIPTAPTANVASNDTQIATTAFVKSITSAIDLSAYATTTALNAAIQGLVNSAPGVLDTLAELATALGNDANFAVNLTNTLANKLDANSTIDGGTIA
jgi:hypothetical protein